MKRVLFFGYFVKYVLIGFFYKRILLIDYTGFGSHIGAKTTSKNLLKIIQQRKDCAVLPLPIYYSPSLFDQFPKDKEIETYIKLYKRNHPFRMWLMNFSDEIVINGEGTLHEYVEWQKSTKPFDLLLEAYIAKVVFKKPIQIVNHSFYYLHSESPFATWGKKVYAISDYIAVREPLSFERLELLNISNYHLSADAVFMTERNTTLAAYIKNKYQLKEPFIVLSFKVGHRTVNKDCFRMYWEKFQRSMTLPIYALPIDEAEYQFFKSSLPASISLIPVLSNELELMSFLSLATLVLTGRYHVGVFSAITETPFLPFHTNTDKMEALVKHLNYEVSVLNFDQQSPEEILTAVQFMLKNRKVLSEHLGSRLTYLRQLSQNNYTATNSRQIVL